MLVTIPWLRSTVTSSQLNWATYTDDQLVSLIIEAQGDIAAALGWRVEATHGVENIFGTGTNRLRGRFYPICYTNHIFIVYPGSSTQQNVEVYNVNQVVTQPETGEYLNYNPFIYQTSGYLTIFPSGTPVQLDYVYGFPMTTLAVDASAGATALTLASGFGFGNGLDYTIYDGVKTEIVKTAPSTATSGPTYTAGTNPVNLITPTQFAHTAAATLAVTNMPQQVLTVVARIIEQRLIGKNNPIYGGLKSRSTGDPMKIVESFIDVQELRIKYIQQLLPTLNRNVGIF